MVAIAAELAEREDTAPSHTIPIVRLRAPGIAEAVLDGSRRPALEPCGTHTAPAPLSL